MAYLSKWYPTHTRGRFPMELFDEVFNDFFPAAALKPKATGWSPRVDLKETPEAYVVEVEVPGFDPELVEVTFEDGTLTLKGERKSEEKREEDTFHVVERSYGSFERSFRFPLPVDAEGIEAKFDKGLLEITLGKTQKPKPKQIEIKAQ